MLLGTGGLMAVLRIISSIDDRMVMVQTDLLDVIRLLVGDEPRVNRETGGCLYCGSGGVLNDEHKSDCIWAEAKRILAWTDIQKAKNVAAGVSS